MSSKNPETRVILLKRGEQGEEVLNKIPTGTKLIFRLSPNLHGLQIRLFTNYTVGEQKAFERKTYYELELSDKNYDEETHSTLQVKSPGTFHFYFEVCGSKDENSTVGGGGRFIVDPYLTIRNGEYLSLDSISMITYMAKQLGKFKDWEGRLDVAKETGFNFIHFTPVQSLGVSQSGYSILDQLELNPSFGQVTWKEVGLFVQRMQEDWGVLSLCDIVLNHTANETPWLKSHPESAYNLVNCPHLVPAYLLDRLLVSLSEEVAQDKFADRGVPSALNSEDHLNNIRGVLHERINELRLEEFYMINPKDCKIDTPSGGDPVGVVHTYKRFGSKVGGSVPRWKVDELNETTTRVIKSHLYAAVENIIAGIRYERVQSSGPRVPKVTKHSPLVPRYFEEVNGFLETMTPEAIALDATLAPFIMAHNGWVMNDDPLRNFADQDSNVYLRRELIAWGDSVKLRYGSSPQDSPFLWSLMREYTELVALTFHGLRLDNCHSTPLHVAEYLIDAARLKRPNLLVVAELFTNSDAKDNVFVNHLGINVLIREAQQAWSSHEQGRLLFRFGGKPVGAFENTAPPPIANALLFDQTHDNPSAIEKRCIKDVLPTAALVSFGACAVGSNRGYDDLVPNHIHVVTENRLYTSLTSNPNPAAGEINLNNGILLARKNLNKVHYYLGQNGYSETYVDQLDPDVVSITRSNPTTRESMVLVSYTAFGVPPTGFQRAPFSVRGINVEGEITQVVFEGSLTEKPIKFEKSDIYINGLHTELDWKENLSPENSKFIEIHKENKHSRVNFKNLQPGCVVAIKTIPFKTTTAALRNLSTLLNSEDLSEVVSKLSLISLNYVLYRCEKEEGSVYNIPNFGDLIYAGLQGVASILDSVSVNNDLGHPICANLREGNWLMECIVERLVKNEETRDLGIHVGKYFDNVKELPRYLIPTYFDQVFKKVYAVCVNHGFKLMNVIEDGEFSKLLALSSLQFVGIADGGALPAGGENYSFFQNDKPYIAYSLCAGLPHFSTGYMRNWGRDTFIAFPGLLLLTQRYEEAKEHILSYASVMKNGLIPNLMNQGNCRYNCRDATWWWLYAIVKYIDIVPNGATILNENVNTQSGVLKLQDIAHLSIQSHFRGISFREENAGPQIDAHMKDEGFNINIQTDLSTGFIHGGNAFNCGTWMDKMGCSAAGGNRGIPATPRDGASVEIIGLSAAVLKKFAETPEFQYKVVEKSEDIRLSYGDWYTKIKENFEPHYFIPASSVDPLVNNKNIYKDTLGASNKFGDYQLRPNFLVAMVVAPELFKVEHARLALGTVHDKLLGPLGMRTLDESDWNYNGDYYNSDSSDYKTAGGFNYHQGPEWVWPMGYYLRARLQFFGQAAVPDVRQIMSKHYEHLKTSPWRSLPELTNKDGKECGASCPAQAWSNGTLLEVLFNFKEFNP